jgi:hypothetical protein
MQEKFPDFKGAAKEIDELSLEGFFGESAKELTLSRSILGQAEFFSACLDEWIVDENQYGKDEVKRLIIVFIQLYTESIAEGGQKAIDAITSFIRGSAENPETECLSSFTEFFRLHVETKKLMRYPTNNQTVPSLSEKKRLGSSLSNTYSKGVELISKILNACIMLLEISKGIQPNELEIYNLFLWKKIKRFKKLSDKKYGKIITSIDRDIRNAEAHLNLQFITEKGVFKYKVKDGKRIKSKEISAENFILNKYPKIGWVAQGFIYSSILLILAHLDKNLYKTKIHQIFG